ncbi:response regulator [Thalassotalea aquiviva]|uniref:response regulator n=1 Tax=Thalassotalea aquiviva TaxID=3242415 RepID=UPI00352A4AE2
MKPHILVIDDDQELTELLNEFLCSEGFLVSLCHDGVSGLNHARKAKYDLILLDVMMPGLTGFELLTALGGHHHTPILMLTAKGDDYDRVLGLELGADDYLAKPYNPKELLARIHAILRRIDILKRQQKQHTLKLNHIQLDPATREVLHQQKSIALTGTEFEILQLLMEHSDSIVSKQTISKKILNRNLMAYDRSIDMHMSNIRKKLHIHEGDEKIKTIRGVGYVFVSGHAQ